MDATLKFNLPDDEDDLQLSLMAWRWKAVVSDLDQWLKAKIKYDGLPEIEVELFAECREQLSEFIKERSLEL